MQTIEGLKTSIRVTEEEKGIKAGGIGEIRSDELVEE